MHANDAQIVRVYTKRKDATISDQTYPSNQKFVITIEAEAGTQVFADAMDYHIRVVVRDLTGMSVVLDPNDPDAQLKGRIRGADQYWNTLDLTHDFPEVPAQGESKEGHVYQVIAHLTVGDVNPNISFAVSPLFCITPALP